MSVKTFVIGAGLATGGMLLITAIKPSVLEHVSHHQVKSAEHYVLHGQTEIQSHYAIKPKRQHT